MIRKPTWKEAGGFVQFVGLIIIVATLTEAIYRQNQIASFVALGLMLFFIGLYYKLKHKKNNVEKEWGDI